MNLEREMRDEIDYKIDGIHSKDAIKIAFKYGEFIKLQERNHLEKIVIPKIVEIKEYIIERLKYYQAKQDASHFWNEIQELKLIEKRFSNVENNLIPKN